MERDYTKLNSTDAPWLNVPSARAVCDAILAGGHQVYYVGGCVRNALLGEPMSDVDMATSATPDQVIALTKAANLKPVPTGIDHGTITVVSDGVGYEVTTFRRDVETDGRRAVVAFSTDILDDARRRDFTMNALYADRDGAVIDPLGGLDDLRMRRVRFIENAEQRIREDYLRTLRYFRFHAWYGDTSEGLDADALAAIGSNLSGLETLSAERVGTEIKKLLAADDPSTALAAMAQTGVLGTILSGADPKLTMLMIHGATHVNVTPDWIGRLVSMGGADVPSRLRLSNAEKKKYETIYHAAYDGPSLLGVAYEHGSEIAVQAHLIQSAIAETLPNPSYVQALIKAAEQVFPISASDLMPQYQGAALGACLAELKAAWISSAFEMQKAELLKAANL
ncbi:CCA tRNA nucleotidyltransferase [Sulfitobacter donghicola]|uniref:Poly(A) polymerase n=1 Tax=Sulfitobacter donghicola DSW-25 = KCTC 12864 = JCM 14565 TaxID=1300350 RepID=A0A073IME5_9RHOB|nr:CCA tRNA nucleotidyltransferase [Sulfitobacter donghicola]KEJ90671.1 poly(A) polymerase [Sulfitobacter donghicola DSW-25 = KCTC 12864 = JCM 14565]KIN67922.1 tRNA nucleotidyltransferase [Sulfitobacter donghicola DSW-25 = KCTC 12864 = JCM 14565]